MRVGLYGGSFNPPHAGHLHVARTAAKALGLQRVVFLVSPQNPLKRASAPQAQRVAATRRLIRDRRFSVSGVEADLGSPYTIDAIRFFKRRYPATRLVWIMGSDNLISFPQWRAWRRIVREIEIAIAPRPGTMLRGRLAPAWRQIRKYGQGRFLEGPVNVLSSTALRISGTS